MLIGLFLLTYGVGWFLGLATGFAVGVATESKRILNEKQNKPTVSDLYPPKA